MNQDSETPTLEIIVVLEDGTRHVCHPPLVDTESGPRRATEQELAAVLVSQTLSKPQPCGFALKSGGSVILGPMVAARAQFFITPIKDGPVVLPEAPAHPEHN